LWDIVEDSYTTYDAGHQLTEDEKKELKENKIKNAKAPFLIQQGVAENIFSRIINKTKSKDAWDMLEQEFKGSAKVQVVKLQTLCRQYQNLQMKDSEKVKEYFSQIMDLVNHMHSLKDKDITEQKLVEKILISLPESFDSIVITIEESKDLATLPIQQLICSLEAHEEKKLQRNISNENAFKASFDFKFENFQKKDGDTEPSKANRWCEICKKDSHDTKYCWSTKQCNKCKKKGCIARLCRTKGFQQSKEATESAQPSTQANFIEQRENSETIFYACHFASEEKNDVWYLDSGCTNHITGNHQFFYEINTSFETSVRMGNDTLIQAKGKGTITVHTKTGLRFMRDVLLVLDLKHNLLSVGQLVQNGYAVHFKKNGCKIIDRHGQVLANIGMEDNKNCVTNEMQDVRA
jgi:gag-polypeptide of LTR copia-type